MCAGNLSVSRSLARVQMVVFVVIGMLTGMASHGQLGRGLLAQGQQDTSSPGVEPQTMSRPVPWGKRVTLDSWNQPLVDVISDLEKVIGHPIYIDHRALADAGIPLDRSVSLQLKDVTVEALLDFLCETNDLDYYIRDRFIVLTTPEDAAHHLVTHVYPVADLIDYRVQTQLRSQSTKERDDDFRFFGLAASPDTPTTYRSEARDELMLTLQAHVNPDSWDVNGGYASCSLYGDLLIVSTTERGHRAVRAMLKNLRRHIEAGQR